MKCGDCKFWHVEKPMVEVGSYMVENNAHIKEWKFARDYIKKHGSSHQGFCTSSKMDYDSVAKIDGLAYIDSENWSAALLTGKDFGCIHFESK